MAAAQQHKLELVAAKEEGAREAAARFAEEKRILKVNPCFAVDPSRVINCKSMLLDQLYTQP